MSLLPESFYSRNDVVEIAHDLIGKYLYTNINNCLCGGLISETEAYNGVIDKASHAYGGRRTQRTEVMYRKGGCSYVYLCYGVHYLLNVVTGPEEIPHAVLIRGIIPVEGIEIMQKRTGKKITDSKLTDGPGKLSKALGINIKHNGVSFFGKEIYIMDKGVNYKKEDILAGPRIGVDYAGLDANLPYRFLLNR